MDSKLVTLVQHISTALFMDLWTHKESRYKESRYTRNNSRSPKSVRRGWGSYILDFPYKIRCSGCRKYIFGKLEILGGSILLIHADVFSCKAFGGKGFLAKNT